MARKAKSVEGVYERVAGSNTWYARLRVNGKLVRRSFGQDRAAAVAWVEKARTVRRSGEGILPATAKLPVRTLAEVKTLGSATLLDELLDDALAYSKRHHNDKINPESRIRVIRKALAGRVADSVTPAEVEAFLDSLNVSAGTEARYKTTLSLAYRLGLKAGKCTRNPTQQVEPRKVNSGVLRYLLPDEEKRLRKVIAEKFAHHMPELDVALTTGLRKGEQYGLKWPDVDFHARVIKIGKTKNGYGRTVHMNDRCLAAMKALKEAATGDSVFNISENREWWARALKAAKIQDFRWHDLRHTFCSRLAMNGVNLRVIQEAAGHRTIAMTSRYAHLDHSTVANALAALN